MSETSAAGSSGCECDGEEQDEASLSNNVLQGLEQLNLQDKKGPANSNEDELSIFRQQWQRELEGTPSPHKELQHKVEELEPINDDEKAKQLFLRGVEFERSGKLYEAIQHYKRAMQIVPDIEVKLYQSSEQRGDTPEEESENEEEITIENTNVSDDEDTIEGEDLLSRLQRILARKGRLCEPETACKGGHLSWLPYEVIQLILRWVVSSDLDATSLERAAGACRGLYVAAREPDLWRSMCVKTWGIECGTPRAGGYSSWRAMYVERPRLQLHGVYISHATYLRHGENSFQDQFYRPWYIVHYYRYLRFFPEGLVLSWSTPEEPAACVAALRPRAPRLGLGILAGHYRLVGDKVVIVLKKPACEKKPSQTSNTRFRTRRKEPEQQEQIFHLELELSSVRGRRNSQLRWRGYSASLRRDQWTQFELTPARFPPFSFSRVRHYTALAAAPLGTTQA